MMMGQITLDSEDHSISFSFNRITTPETDEEKRKYEMIQDVMGTPRSKPLLRVEDLDWENDLKSRFLGWKCINKYLIKINI